MLTQMDLEEITKLLDKELDKKLKPILEIVDFTKKGVLALLDESEETFKQKLNDRVKKLEDIHPGGHHAS